MSAATIIFLDIVGFSKNPNSRQRELIDSLTSEVVSSLSSLTNPALDTPHVVAMPTGDGMALAFLHEPHQPWDISTIMGLIHRVQHWAKSKDVSLRTGVHAGEVDLITVINNKTNIVGDTINYTQRVMDAANPRQVLFSDVAFRQYIGSNNPSYSGPPYSPDCKAVFEGPFEVQAKHGMSMLVYKMTLNPPQEWLSNDDPVSKKPIVMEPTPASLLGRRRRRTRLAAVAVVLAVVLVAGIAGTILLLGRQDRGGLATSASEATATSAATKIVTKFDVSYGTANASGWKWGVAEITTGTQELTRDTDTHSSAWIFYVVRGSTEIGTADGKRVIPAGDGPGASRPRSPLPPPKARSSFFALQTVRLVISMMEIGFGSPMRLFP